MSSEFSLRIASISQRDQQWRHKTTERYRIDEHSIDRLYAVHGAKVQPAALQAAAGNTTALSLESLLHRIESWVRFVLLNPRSNAPLRITRHVAERLNEYENRMSRCGKFVELYSDEKAILEQLPKHLNSSAQFKIVEVGLNASKDVCKIALLVPLDQLMRKKTKRKLFLLVGCDGGLKSMYVVDGFKKRSRYHAKGDIVQLTVRHEQHRSLRKSRLAVINADDAD